MSKKSARLSRSTKRRVCRGADEIAKYLTENHCEFSSRQVRYAAERGRLPVFRMGRVLFANTRRLDEHFGAI